MLPLSYRPISLLDIVRKLFKKFCFSGSLLQSTPEVFWRTSSLGSNASSVRSYSCLIIELTRAGSYFLDRPLIPYGWRSLFPTNHPQILILPGEINQVSPAFSDFHGIFSDCHIFLLFYVARSSAERSHLSSDLCEWHFDALSSHRIDSACRWHCSSSSLCFWSNIWRQLSGLEMWLWNWRIAINVHENVAVLFIHSFTLTGQLFWKLG